MDMVYIFFPFAEALQMRFGAAESSAKRPHKKRLRRLTHTHTGAHIELWFNATHSHTHTPRQRVQSLAEAEKPKQKFFAPFFVFIFFFVFFCSQNLCHCITSPPMLLASGPRQY